MWLRFSVVQVAGTEAATESRLGVTDTAIWSTGSPGRSANLNHQHYSLQEKNGAHKDTFFFCFLLSSRAILKSTPQMEAIAFFSVPTQLTSPVCLHVCKAVYTWVKLWGWRAGGKGGIASHEGTVVRHCGPQRWGPPSSLSRLAPHLPVPSVHLPIAHLPTPSSTISLTIADTVLDRWLALCSFFYTKEHQIERQTTVRWLCNTRTVLQYFNVILKAGSAAPVFNDRWKL